MNVSKVSKDGFLRTQTGTPYYASPEVWKDMKYNNKSDIWSLGCVLYESITLKPPFRAMDMEELYNNVIAGIYEKIPRSYSKDLSNIIELLLNTNPDFRPSCDQILGFDFVSKHFPQKSLVTSNSSLLKPIKLPNDISMLSYSLPRPDYEGFDSVPPQNKYHHHAKNSIEDINKKSKLPLLKLNQKTPKKCINTHNAIENSTDRLKRIREIYLTPSYIFLTPNYKKSNKNIISKRNIPG